MKNNTSFHVGSLILINKINNKYNLFDNLFTQLKGKTKHLIESVKMFVNNRLDKCMAVSKMLDIYPEEWFECLGFKEKPKERTMYRDLERIGINYKFVIEKYQQLLKNHNLIDLIQCVDFSSSFFEGNSSELGALGYSRDSQPSKKQLVFGISTGMNGIPSALTVQRGNVQDKEHMKFMLKVVSKVLEKGSLVILDCGGNTQENKEKIIFLELNYLTLNLYKKLIKTRNKKFQKELKKNDKIIEKVKKGKTIDKFISRIGEIITKGEIQTVLCDVKNPYVSGLEGFFILESSVDDESYKMLKLYKNKDFAEKLIRNMKEGTELRPINHISKEAIIGYMVIVFLTNCIIQLSHLLNNSNVGKNLKSLRKTLNCLTLTTIYNKNVFKFSVLSNISDEIRKILGDSLKEFSEKPPDWI